MGWAVTPGSIVNQPVGATGVPPQVQVVAARAGAAPPEAMTNTTAAAASPPTTIGGGLRVNPIVCIASSFVFIDILTSQSVQ
jgi:hypothetical protein